MKPVFFLVFFFLSLLFEISFMSFWGFSAPVSFWFFSISVFFLKEEDIFIFGALSSVFVSVFFAPSSLYPLLLILVAVSAFLVKSFRGFNIKTAFAAHILSAIFLFESARVFIFFPTGFSAHFLEETAINGVFLVCLLVVTVFYEFRRGLNKGYSI